MLTPPFQVPAQSSGSFGAGVTIAFVARVSNDGFTDPVA